MREFISFIIFINAKGLEDANIERDIEIYSSVSRALIILCT